ncbi:MAG: NAD(P)-binding domain-containing protein [Pseudomonadota bacterium]
MKIGIIGSGNMGRALGVRLASLGHEVLFGARRLDQAQAAADAAGAGVKVGDTDAAAGFGDVVIWTVRSSDPGEVLSDPMLLDGRIVVDLNNRDYATDVRQGHWFGEAIAERLQEAAPGARVVKALNTIAMETFNTASETLRSAGAQSFIAGRDEAAKAIVSELLNDLGFEAVDLGEGAAAFRAAEALGDVIRLLMIDGGRGGRAHLGLSVLPEPDLKSIGPRAPSKYR